MAIQIKGIRIEQVTITRPDPEYDEDPRKPTIASNYSLLSSADKVLAKQDVGGYNGLKIEISDATFKALTEFLRSYKADINSVLGLEAE